MSATNTEVIDAFVRVLMDSPLHTMDYIHKAMIHEKYELVLKHVDPLKHCEDDEKFMSPQEQMKREEAFRLVTDGESRQMLLWME